MDLTQFDTARTIRLDPAVWANNLAALTENQPDFALILKQTPLPAHWLPVDTLDASTSFRVEAEGQPPRWLGGSAAPAVRAEALIREHELANKNPALPMVAAGAELVLLLSRLAATQAVYVFEEHLACLAAVLRIRDVAMAIRSGRCVLVPPDDERGFVSRLMERYPGLLPPGAIIPLPGVGAGRLGQLHAVCESVARNTSDARDQAIRKLADRRPRETARRHAAPRVALLALGAHPDADTFAGFFASAARDLGWSACRCTAAGPRDVHPLPHCEKLAAFDADFCICVGHEPALLPIPAARQTCQWHLDACDVPETFENDETIHLAATPRVVEALRSSGVAESKVVEFYWSYPYRHVQGENRGVPCKNSAVVIVADLPDAEASACGVEHPTHKRLWEQLRTTAADAWRSSAELHPVTLLRAAERATGVKLSDTSLRARMIRIIEFVLIPAVILERILQTLGDASFDVHAVGRGWRRLLPRPGDVMAESMFSILDNSESTAPTTRGHAHFVPLAAIFAGSLDPLRPEMLAAASLDWPMLIHAPGSASLTPRLGGLLHPSQHYDRFGGPKELQEALTRFRDDPGGARRRCRRARDHLQEQHSTAERLQALAQRLGLAHSEGAR